VAKLGLRFGEKDSFWFERIGTRWSQNQVGVHTTQLLAVAFKRNRSKINTNGEAL